MRGFFSLFLDAYLNAGVKTMIFDLSGGGGGRGLFWVPPVQGELLVPKFKVTQF